MKSLSCLLVLLFMIGCSVPSSNGSDEKVSKPPIEKLFPALESDTSLAQATFAGGCFWCTESSFQVLDGVAEALSGYAGGDGENPTYQNHRGYREAIRVYYNPEQINYTDLVKVFWKTIDPVDAGGQFADRGHSYTTAIYYANDEEKQIAETSKQALAESGEFDEPIATEILPLTTFYPAEEYHQDFYLHSHERYKGYKNGSGRTKYFEERDSNSTQGSEETGTQEKNSVPSGKDGSSYDLTPEEIEERRKNLDPLSYHVIAEEGTERPFENTYWDHKAQGIYVDKVSGEPLFSSTHKYDSGTGWPSFYQTLQEDAVTMHEDNSLALPRTEIRSAEGDSHLGHVFDDGPEEHGGQRFCTNSASLEFVPLEELESRGYGKWKFLFEDEK